MIYKVLYEPEKHLPPLLGLRRLYGREMLCLYPLVSLVAGVLSMDGLLGCPRQEDLLDSSPRPAMLGGQPPLTRALSEVSIGGVRANNYILCVVRLGVKPTVCDG